MTVEKMLPDEPDVYLNVTLPGEDPAIIQESAIVNPAINADLIEDIDRLVETRAKRNYPIVVNVGGYVIELLMWKSYWRLYSSRSENISRIESVRSQPLEWHKRERGVVPLNLCELAGDRPAYVCLYVENDRFCIISSQWLRELERSLKRRLIYRS